MSRRSLVQRLAELADDVLTVEDAGDGWPAKGTVEVNGAEVPVSLWVGPVGQSHRGRHGVERRFQNPGSNRAIIIDRSRVPLLVGLWESDSRVDVGAPVIVVADAARRASRSTRFSVFVNLAALLSAVHARWAEHRNDDGELLRYASPSAIGDMVLAGETLPDWIKDFVDRDGPARVDSAILLSHLGLTLGEIGSAMGVTRERARQILRDRAPEVAEARKKLAARRRQLLTERRRHTQSADRLHRIREELTARGINADDVLADLERSRIASVTAERFGLDRRQVLALHEASGVGLRLAFRPMDPEVRYDHESCVAYLRLAAEQLDVATLSAATYEQFAASQTLTVEVWPSAQTIMKRFDTWTEALDAAGLVRSRHSARVYKQRFPPARCREFLDRYARETLSSGARPTLAGFGVWSRENGGPSTATMRNRLGRWSDALAASLRRIEG